MNSKKVLIFAVVVYSAMFAFIFSLFSIDTRREIAESKKLIAIYRSIDDIKLEEKRTTHLTDDFRIDRRGAQCQ